MNWYLKVLKQYADFSGRARRKEYWMFLFFNTLFALIAMIFDNILGIAFEGQRYGPVYVIYALVVLIPGIAVAVRRLHDVGKSGSMLLIALIPLIGTIWLLVLMVTDSDHGENKYGENPKDSVGVSVDEPSSDTIILLIVLWMFASRLFYSLISIFYESFFREEWFSSVNTLMTLIWAMIPIGLASIVKSKSKQILLFVLGAIYFVHGTYEVINEYIQF